MRQGQQTRRCLPSKRSFVAHCSREERARVSGRGHPGKPQGRSAGRGSEGQRPAGAVTGFCGKDRARPGGQGQDRLAGITSGSCGAERLPLVVGHPALKAEGRWPVAQSMRAAWRWGGGGGPRRGWPAQTRHAPAASLGISQPSEGQSVRVSKARRHSRRNTENKKAGLAQLSPRGWERPQRGENWFSYGRPLSPLAE